MSSSASRPPASFKPMNGSSSSATNGSSSKQEPDDLLLFDDGELERILNQDAALATREAEVERVMRAFRLNPYEILELPILPLGGVSDTDIQKSYRKKSLLIHPDKLKHPKGIEAFDLLKKASTEMTDSVRRKLLDEHMMDARMLVLREFKLSRDLPDDDERIVRGIKDPGFEERVRRKAKEVLIDDELRKRRMIKMTMIAEGAEAKRVEEEQEKRKRKIEDQQKWEDSREDRVSDWRSFQRGETSKKKKKKLEVLG